MGTARRHHPTWEETKAKAKAIRAAQGFTPEQEAERQARMDERVAAMRAELRKDREAAE